MGITIDEKIKKLQSEISELENKKKVLKKTNIDVENLLFQVKKQIGLKLLLVRTQKKISKTTLSELSGVSRMTIHRAEIGESLLGIDSIIRLCIALKCDFDHLVSLKSCSDCGNLIEEQNEVIKDLCSSCIYSEAII